MPTDKLRAEANERVDLEDFLFQAQESQMSVARQAAAQFLTDPNLAQRAWILEGFAIDNPTGKQLRVTKGSTGRAILSQREGALTHDGVIVSEGDSEKIVDMTSFSSATYGIYLRFEFVDGDQASRVFWDPSGSGSEFPQTIVTRRQANWSLRVETSSPGNEWFKIGEVVQSTMAITDQRNLYFEGSVSGSYATTWGSGNDRNSDRQQYGIFDLQRFTEAVRTLFEDLRPSGGKWYEARGIEATGKAGTNEAGVKGTGGTTNGIGVHGVGTGTGAGVKGQGGSGVGVYGVAGGTNQAGVSGEGTGTGAGVRGEGESGSTGPGLKGVGGDGGGLGVEGSGEGSASGVKGTGGSSGGKGGEFAGQGTGTGVKGTGGTTGWGVEAYAGGSTVPPMHMGAQSAEPTTKQAGDFTIVDNGSGAGANWRVFDGTQWTRTVSQAFSKALAASGDRITLSSTGWFTFATTFTIPAGHIRAGSTVRIRACVDVSNIAAGNGRVRLVLDDGTVRSVIASAQDITGSGQDAVFDCCLVARDPLASSLEGPCLLAVGVSGTAGVVYASQGVATVTTTGAVVVKVQADASVGNGSTVLDLIALVVDVQS